MIFIFNDPATTHIYTLSLHDALPISYFPVNTLMLMRGAIVSQKLGCLGQYVDVMFKAMWEQGEKLEDVAVIEKVLRRSEEHTSELQSRPHLACRLLLEKKNNK